MKLIACIVPVLTILLAGCTDLVRVERPKTEITDVMVFENDATALSAVRGIYSEMSESPFFLNTGIAVMCGLASDELASTVARYDAFFRNELSEDNSTILNGLYAPAYRSIYLANSVLEGVESSSSLTAPVRTQVKGEALFIRAICYFNLVNLFGAVPYVGTTDIELNSRVSRSAPEIILGHVETDLIEAKSLLTKQYNFTSAGERIQATYWAACGLLSRLYLFQKKWSMAEQAANEVIEQSDLFSLQPLEDVFKWDSQEAIFQLYPVIPMEGAMDAKVFVANGRMPQFTVSEPLLGAFEDGDRRLSEWVGSVDVESARFFFPAKYKSLTEKDCYHSEIRLAELFLIRAECRARLYRWDEALGDLNQLRERAGLDDVSIESIASLEEMIDQIMHERQVELFAEGGHRWYDLKRTAMADQVLGSLSSKDWQTTDALFPIPRVEIANNSNLEPQNPGY